MLKGNGKRGTVGVELIGAFKLIKAALLFAAAILLPIAGRHQTEVLYGLVQHVSIDPHAHYFQEFVRRFVQLSPRFPLIAVGMFFYGGLFGVEGVGLVLQKHWAEYLTTWITGSFLPIELYEAIHKMSAVKGVIIVLNVAIVIYLVVRIRARCRENKQSGARAEA